MRNLWFAVMIIFSSHVASDETVSLEQQLQQLKTYQASFVQTVSNREEGTYQQSSGELFLQKPDKFRWQYSGEYGQLILGDGLSVWLLDTELEQVTQQFQSLALKGTPADILLGDKKISDNYYVTEIAVPHSQLVRYSLKPKDEDSQFLRIELVFNDNIFTELYILNQFGQESRLSFSDISVNNPIDPDKFVFVSPEGYDFFEH